MDLPRCALILVACLKAHERQRFLQWRCTAFQACTKSSSGVLWINMDRLARQLHFILELDKLKSVYRRTYLLDETRSENSAEHSWHLALMAIVLAEHANEPLDVGKVIRMVLIHDIGYPSGPGTLAVDIPAGAARSLEIVINGDASGGNDGWWFSAILVSCPIDFQWRRGNQMIWGGSDGNLTIPVTRMSDAGDYTVLVSDHVGSVLSLPATLTLTPPILRLDVVTEPPGGLRLWWTSPDHLPEFISDLTNANNPDSWSIVPDWYNGIVLLPTEEPQFFRLRMFND